MNICNIFIIYGFLLICVLTNHRFYHYDFFSDKDINLATIDEKYRIPLYTYSFY